MPPTKKRNSLIARWGAIAGAFLALLGGSLAPNLIASDLFAWAFTPENINIYRVLIGIAWVLFALFMFATLRAQKQSGSQTNINTGGGSSVGGSVNANEFVGRDKIQNFFSDQRKLEVLRETNYANIVGGLGKSGSIRWVDRGASTTAQLQARGRIAIIGEMKSGKTREAAELIRRAAAEGLIQTVYAPVAFPENLDETQLREAVQREIDATRHCALFVDELDLHSDDFKLARLSMYYNAMLAVRPDAQFIITAQEERLMPDLREWLEERNFFFVKVPDLNADQRLKIVQDGASLLNVTLADAETQHILAEQTDGRPYSIIFALQQTGEEMLTADKAQKLVEQSMDVGWAMQRREREDKYPYAKYLLESIAVFISAGATPRAHIARRYADFLAKTKRERITTQMRKDGEMCWVQFDIIANDEVFVIPEPLVLPLLIDRSEARNCLALFLEEAKKPVVVTLVLLLLKIVQFYFSFQFFFIKRGEWLVRHLFLPRAIENILNKASFVLVVLLINIFIYILFLKLLFALTEDLLLNLGVLLLFYAAFILLVKLPLSSNAKILVLLQKAKIPNIFDLISWLSNWLTPYVSDKNLVIEQIGQTFSQSNRFLAIWHTLNGEVALDIGNYSTAIKSYEKGIELDSKYAKPYIGLGNVYSDQGDYVAAVKAYEQAIELDSKDAIPYNQLGNMYYSGQRNYFAAIKAYEQAIELDPKYAAPHNGLGNVYRDQGDYPAAIKAYEQAIALDPKDAYPHNGLGNVYSDQGDYPAAIKAYEQAIALDPKDAYPHIGLGLVYLALGKPEQAIDSFNEYLKKDKEDYFILFNLGLAHGMLGQAEQATNFWRRGMALCQGQKMYDKVNRALYTLALGDAEEGLRQMRDLVANGAPKGLLREILGDARLLARCLPPPAGIDEMIALLESAVA